MRATMIRRIGLGLVSALALNPSTYAADDYSGIGGLKDGPQPYAVSISDIYASNNQVAVEFVTMNFDYKETFQGPADTEKGWVPGVGLSLTLQRDWFVNNLYFNAQLSWKSGKTDYAGSYQDQPFGSLVGRNGADVQDYDFRLGKGFSLQPNVQATPFFGIGYHEWNRKVNAGEDYSHAYAGGGLLLQWAPIQCLVLSADGFVGGTFDSQIDIKTIPGPDGIIGSTLPLGNSTIWKAGISADYALTQNIHVNAGAEWTAFTYGESPLDSTGEYLEPHSDTTNVIVKAGVGYAFGGDYTPLK